MIGNFMKFINLLILKVLSGDCLIKEDLNLLGPQKCSVDSHCKGDRMCNTMGLCFGVDNCH